MNDDRDLERRVSSTYDEMAPAREPHGLLDNVLLTTGQTRQRPAWLAYLKEPPMRHSSQLAVGSPTFRIAAIMVATLLLALTVVGAGIAGSRLLAADGAIVVDQNDPAAVQTITEAVSMAEDGDTILVMPGVYTESITIAKDIIIRGDGDRDDIVIEVTAEIPPAADGRPPVAFQLESSNAIIENLTLRGDSSRLVILGGAPTLRHLMLDGIGQVYGVDPEEVWDPSGVQIRDGSTATIEDSVFAAVGTTIETGSSPILSGNVITVGFLRMEGSGVDPTITGNQIRSESDWGIAIWGGAKPIVTGNTISSPNTAIDLRFDGWLTDDTGPDPMIRDNTIVDSGLGINAPTGTSATIDGNTFRDNNEAMSLLTPDVFVVNNVVRGGPGGIVTAGDGEPRFEDNDVEGAEGRGMAIMAGSPVLSGNRLCGNGENLFVFEVRASPDIDDSNQICEDAMPAG